MKMLKTILTFCLLSLFSLPLWAFEESTFTLKLVNQSHQTLTYTGVTGANPGNEFTVNSPILKPGETMIIKGSIHGRNCLAGTLHFTDLEGNDNSLFLLDKLQYKAGQLLLALNNMHITSEIASKTPNKIVDPIALMYVEATLVLHDTDLN